MSDRSDSPSFTDCLIDGRRADALKVYNRGLHYGDGVFRTVLVDQGRVHDLEGQLGHLAQDCERLAIGCPQDPIREEARNLAQALGSGVLKIIVTRAGGAMGYAPAGDGADGTRLLLTYPERGRPQACWRQGIELGLCETRLGVNPALAGVKHLNRLEQVLARGERRGSCPQEGLMRDTEDHVIAGTMSNLFWAAGGRLHTPALNRCGVSGRMRACILEAAGACGVEVVQGEFGLQDCSRAEEIFVTNSIIGLWPVKRFMQRDYTVPGPVLLRLAAALEHPRLQLLNN